MYLTLLSTPFRRSRFYGSLLLTFFLYFLCPVFCLAQIPLIRNEKGVTGFKVKDKY